MATFVIGDLHGEFEYLEELLVDVSGLEHDDVIIIAGDVGIGFDKARDDWFRRIVETSTPQLRFIRGNHDNPSIIKEMPGFIPDGTINDGILFLGGGWSIDQQYRTPGLNWWPDEQMSYDEWDAVFANPNLHEVTAVISHEAPLGVIRSMGLVPVHEKVYQNDTNVHLEALRSRLPNVEQWVFGHYHKNEYLDVGPVVFTTLPNRPNIDSMYRII